MLISFFQYSAWMLDCKLIFNLSLQSSLLFSKKHDIQRTIQNRKLAISNRRIPSALISYCCYPPIICIIHIDDVSLCTLFANTLDNAIEACQKIEDPDRRKLELKCRYTENGYFSLELINSKINEIVVQKNQYISDKEDKSAHGIGISSIRDIVEKYEGTTGYLL